MGELLWSVIVQKCPEIAQAIEDKIAEEVGKKQSEIDDLRSQLELIQTALDELILGGGL